MTSVIERAARALVERYSLSEQTANAAARAVLEAIGYTWRPIESAPRDGSQFDAWNATYSERLCAVRWNPGKSRFEEWSIDVFDRMDWCKVDGVLSHWLPLPEEPDAALREGE